MKRRTFFSKATGLTLGAATGIVASTVTPRRAFAKKKLRWRMALAVPKTLAIWGPGMERFAAQVKELSDGELSIRVYGAGELVPALGTFDAVSAGEIQMGHAASYYWQGKLPASPFFTNVPFGMDSRGMHAWLQHGGGQELWDELMQPYKVRCIPCGNTGHQPTGWFNKEIKTIADLKGLKVRVPGLAGKVYARAGAAPILLPGGDLYTSLATGVIDAVEWVGPYHDVLMGLHKAATILYGTSWHEPGPVLELMINDAAWNSLTPRLQSLVKMAAADTTLWMQTQWEAQNARYLQQLKKEEKIRLLSLPPEVLSNLKKHSDALLEEIAGTNALARKIYNSYMEFMKEFNAYQSWVEDGFFCNS